MDVVTRLDQGDLSFLNKLTKTMTSINDVIINDDQVDLNLLHIACNLKSTKRNKVVKYLLAAKDIAVDYPSGRGNKGWTAVHIACSNGYADTLFLLLQHQANPFTCDVDGSNAWDVAIEYNEYGCIDVLEEHQRNCWLVDLNTDEDGDQFVQELQKLTLNNPNTDSIGGSSSEDTILYFAASDQSTVLDAIPKPKRSPPKSKFQKIPQPCDLPDDLSCSSIQRELEKYGDSPGPVTPTTKCIYLKRLEQLKQGRCVFAEVEQKYSTELTSFFGGGSAVKEDKANSLEAEFQKHFEEIGGPKAFFNYLLLDPRITKNIPCENNKSELFERFVNAIFYIGKGQGIRPLEHMKEAKKTPKKTSKPKPESVKVERIRDIWQNGYGVLLVKCWDHSTESEALAKEFLMIEAIGLKNLTNIQAGQNNVKNLMWNDHKRRWFGALSLFKAFQIYVANGERQLTPAHV